MNLPDFKDIVKTSVRNAAFEKLQALKESHSKVEHNQYDNLNHPQGYLTSETVFYNIFPKKPLSSGHKGKLQKNVFTKYSLSIV